MVLKPLKKNKKGQVIFFAFMLGITIIVLALALAPAIKESVDEVRDADNMDCGNESISIFDKAGCLAADLTLFHFIGGILAIAIAVLTARIIFA